MEVLTMANSIRSYFDDAQLSLAAYATLDVQMNQNLQLYEEALFRAGMSRAQATRFASDYTVIDQFTDSSTGLSATVFQKGSQYYLAIRGTEGLIDRDFLEDILLGIGGIARTQLISLYNYVQRLITPASVAQNALQVQDVAPDIDPITGYVNDPGGIRQTTSATGLGYLAGVSGVTVTGHSLGGHLAAAASRLFPSLIASTYTYNAPGFNLAVADALLDQFPGDAGTFPSATITNLVAHAGSDIISSIGSLPGTPQRIYIEDQSLVSNFPGNHSIKPLTDALAIYNLFATLDPTATVDTITTILNISAGTDKTTLELALDALRTLFQENYAFGIANTNATPTPIDARESLYDNAIALEDYLKGLPFYNATTQSLGFTVASLAGLDASILAQTAQNDIATRYALYKLNPFVIGNAASLYAALDNTDGALARYNPQTRTGNLTDEYLNDRAAFLTNKIIANTNDVAYVSYAGTPQVFEDNIAGQAPYRVYLGADGSIVNQALNSLSQIRFGGALSDGLTGGDLWDKLYGMDGNDNLTGGKGNDYLEGGKGNDAYYYTVGDGQDIIVDTDGQGHIYYTDATGNRYLLNGGRQTGDGATIYQSPDDRVQYRRDQNGALIVTLDGVDALTLPNFQSGDLGIVLEDFVLPAGSGIIPSLGVVTGTAGNDDIDDVDGAQAIYGLGGDDLLSGRTIQGNQLYSVQIFGGDGNDALYLDDETVGEFYLVPGLTESQRIANFNLTYPNTVVRSGLTGGRLYGEAGNDVLHGSLRDDILDGGTGHDFIHAYYGDDTVLGGLGNDIINGHEGHDDIQGDDGDDRIGGGAGSDRLQGGAGNDRIYGDSDAYDIYASWDGLNGALLYGTLSAGNFPLIKDALEAEAGDDVLEGGAGDDLLFGGAGDDLLDGGLDADELQGEGGDDILYGGDGNDLLFGDSSVNALANDAQVIPGDFGTYTYYQRQRRVGPDGNDYLDGGAGDDKLWGGAGNDHLLEGGDGDDHLLLAA